MASISDYFCGVVDCDRFSQIVAVEMIPVVTAVTDAETGEVKNVVSDYTRNLYEGEYESRSYVFDGVPVALANELPESVEVSEVGGARHKVYFKTIVKDGSSGSAVFEKDKNTVRVHRISPHLRRIEVVRCIGTLLRNDTSVSSGTWD